MKDGRGLRRESMVFKREGEMRKSGKSNVALNPPFHVAHKRTEWVEEGA